MVTMTFNGYVNESLSIGDNLYYVDNLQQVAGFTTDSSTSNYILLGSIISINEGVSSYTLQIDEVVSAFENGGPSGNDFIFFAKDNNVELSSLAGYYGSVTFSNNSTRKAELFSVAVDVTESSK